jgi:hypothetical protein
MPDRLPLPQGGSQPFDDRDLDSLLAGKTSDVPVALRPVAETLIALRAGPARSELEGEELARAAFRDPRSESETEPGTLGTWLPAGHRRVARHPARGWLTGLVAVAAVVLAAAVTYTGNLPDPAQRLAHDTIAAPPAKSHPPVGSSPSVQVNSAQPTPAVTDLPATLPAAPSLTPGVPNRAALCDALRATWQHSPHGRKTHWWQTPQYRQLSTAAGGGGPQQVYAYCTPIWGQQQSTRPDSPPHSPPASPSPRQQDSSQPSQTPGPSQQSGYGPSSNGPNQGTGGSPTVGAGQNGHNGNQSG